MTARDRDDRGRVRIFADLERPDKLLAGLTACQLAILGTAAVVLWTGYAAARHLISAVAYGAAAMLALGRHARRHPGLHPQERDLQRQELQLRRP